MKLSVFSMQRTQGSLPASGQEPPRALPDTADVDSRLRLQVLERALAISAVLGGALYLLSLPGMLDARNWITLGFYGLIVIGLAALTIARRLAYRLRTTAFLGLILASGGFMLALEGLTGSGRLLLLLFPLLAVILLATSRLNRLVVMFLGILLVTVISLFGLFGALPSAGEGGPAWTLAWLGFSLIAITSTLVLDEYVHSLRDSLEEREQAVLAFDRERQRLEFQLQDGTQILEHRLVQIRTAAEITQIIAKELDLERLLPSVCELIKNRFDLYYVGVFLIEPGSDHAVLHAGSGDAGKAMLAEGHQLQIGGDSMIGQATAARQARIALDVGKETPTTRLVRFDNPHLPDTRSEMALPLVSQQTVLGAITIQSDREAAFDEDDIIVLRGIADSLTSAIENAHLFGQIQSNLDEISRLHSQYLRRSWMQIIESHGPQEHLYEADPENSRNSVLDSEPTVQSPYTLQLPILLRDQMIGSLTLESDHVFGDKERALIEAVINQAALALENARLLEETRKRADQETIAANISTKIWSSSDIDTILRTTLQELGLSLEAVQGTIELWPEQVAEPRGAIEADLSGNGSEHRDRTGN